MSKMTLKSEVAHFTNDFAMYAQIGYTEAMEMRIFLGVVSQVDPFDETAPMEGILSLQQMQHLAKGNDKSRSGTLSRDIRRTIKKMLKKNYVEFASPIEYKGESLSKYRVIFDRLDPVKVDGTLFYKWRLHEDMRPHVMSLLNNFVQIALPKSMRSSHSIRFLIMATAHHKRLRKHKKITKLSISITELKRVLNLEGKYADFKNFRVRVIEQIIKEVNNSGLLYIGKCEYLKTGRTITDIDFYLKDGILIDGKKTLSKAKEASSLDEAKSDKTKEVTQFELDEIRHAQYLAYVFLIDKGIYPKIALNQLVKKTPSSEFIGWEDVFFQKAWGLFLTKTKYKKSNEDKERARAFVTWWRNDIFKTDQFSEIIEQVLAEKKGIEQTNQEAFYRRMKAKNMRHDEFVEWHRSGD